MLQSSSFEKKKKKSKAANNCSFWAQLAQKRSQDAGMWGCRRESPHQPKICSPHPHPMPSTHTEFLFPLTKIQAFLAVVNAPGTFLF